MIFATHAEPLRMNFAPELSDSVPPTTELPEIWNLPPGPIPTSPLIAPELNVTLWASNWSTLKALASPRPAKRKGQGVLDTSPFCQAVAVLGGAAATARLRNPITS